MQQVSSNLLSALQSSGRKAARLALVVEIYAADATPGANGFDPAIALLAFAKTDGITYRTKPYSQLLTGTSSINKILKKQLSGASFTLSNSTREIARFERATGFEGLICVFRQIDRGLTTNLNDSIVLFTGRCKKPDTFDRGSETVGISVEQILNKTEQEIPRRKFTPEDEAGRVPSDPLFEGFRYEQRNGARSFTKIVKERFLLFFSRKKKISQTLQYSSHSDAAADRAVPVVLGRAQMQLVNFASEDKGGHIEFTAIACDGEIEAMENLRCVTPGFVINVQSVKTGKPGGTGDQINDAPAGWIGAGVYSRTAYIRSFAGGTTPEVDDAAPDVVAIILGMKVPVPNVLMGAFDQSAFSVNPAYQARWLLNSPDYFDLAAAWFEDAEIRETADYCDHILVDQSNSELVQYNASQTGIAGNAYRNYQSTAMVSPAYWRARAGDAAYLRSAAMLEADYRFYTQPPVSGDDWTGGGLPDYATPPTAYRRRYTSNVALSEKMKLIDYLFDIHFPAFNGYMVQKANGKLAVKTFRPADFTFIRAASAAGASEILVSNINAFRAKAGRLVVGSHLKNAETRTVTGTRYDAAAQISISAAGGVSSSAATLTGGGEQTAPFAVLSVTATAGEKTVNIDGYALKYTSAGADTTATVAAAIASQINSHNELNKYIKAVSIAGESTVTVSSRIGYLQLNAPLQFPHLAAIANPAAAPALSQSARAAGYIAENTGLAAGAWRVSYSYLTIEGETLTSPEAVITLAANQKIDVAAIALPPRVTALKWYCAIEANGIRTRLFAQNAGAAFSISTAPLFDDAVEPIINGTAEEITRIAMAFSDRASDSADRLNSNMLKGTFKFPLGSRQPSTNRIDLKYRDASQDFQLTELRVKDKAHIKKVKKINNLEVNGAAIDSYHQARRIANQKLAEMRDGDLFTGFSSDGEALLLEEGDIIPLTDSSGDFTNELCRVEEIEISDEGGYAKTSITARKYRRAFYDDQIQEKLVPLPLVINSGTNTEQGAPTIWQYAAATNTSVTIGINNYTNEARYRKVEVSPNADMTAAAAQVSEASAAALPATLTITKASEAATSVRYIRVSHSSNGTTFGAPSGVLAVTFADSGGTGGTVGGGDAGTGSGGTGFQDRKTDPFV